APALTSPPHDFFLRFMPLMQTTFFVRFMPQKLTKESKRIQSFLKRKNRVPGTALTLKHTAIGLFLLSLWFDTKH
ncbi:MAG: hypothetical protein ACI30R_11020, partial [Sodaliphilus sp.]